MRLSIPPSRYERADEPNEGYRPQFGFLPLSNYLRLRRARVCGRPLWPERKGRRAVVGTSFSEAKLFITDLFEARVNPLSESSEIALHGRPNASAFE